MASPQGGVSSNASTEIKSEPVEPMDEDEEEEDEDDFVDSLESLCMQYPWLRYSGSQNKVLCQPCWDIGHQAVFLHGTRKEIVQGHADSEMHLNALQIYAVFQQGQMPNADHETQYSVSGAPDDGKVIVGQEETEDWTAEAGAGDMDQVPPSPSSTGSMPTPKEKRVRRFCHHWLSQFPWLKYDAQQNLMYCRFCLTHCRNNNTFVKGNSVFKLMTLQVHAGSKEHQLAEKSECITNPMSAIPHKPAQGPAEAKKDAQAIPPQHTAVPSIGQHLTTRQKFLLQKYFRFFPWLIYSADIGMIVCDICQRHTVNSLYMDVSADIEYKLIKGHCETKNHQVAQEAEVRSWKFVVESSVEQGLDLDNFILRDDTERRIAALFTDAIVTLRKHNADLRKTLTVNEHQGVCGGDQRSEVGSALDDNRESVVGPQPSDLEGSTGMPEESTPASRGKRMKLMPAYGVFKEKWLTEFPWLHYDRQHSIMNCRVCQKHKKKISFATGVRVFSRSYLVGHETLKKHRDALLAEAAAEMAKIEPVGTTETDSMSIADKFQKGRAHSSGEGGSKQWNSPVRFRFMKPAFTSPPVPSNTSTSPGVYQMPMSVKQEGTEEQQQQSHHSSPSSSSHESTSPQAARLVTTTTTTDTVPSTQDGLGHVTSMDSVVPRKKNLPSMSELVCKSGSRTVPSPQHHHHHHQQQQQQCDSVSQGLLPLSTHLADSSYAPQFYPPSSLPSLPQEPLPCDSSLAQSTNTPQCTVLTSSDDQLRAQCDYDLPGGLSTVSEFATNKDRLAIARNEQPQMNQNKDHWGAEMGDNTCTQNNNNNVPGGTAAPSCDSSKKKRIRKFYPKWLLEFQWLKYNELENSMTCKWCVKHHIASSTFYRGSQCFHIDALRSHEGSVSHQQAAARENLATNSWQSKMAAI